MPVEHVIVHTAMMCDMALDPSVDAGKVKLHLTKVKAVMDALQEHVIKVEVENNSR